MSMKGFMTVFGAFVLVMIGSVYMFGVLSAEQSAVNVTGTQYETAYNAGVQMQGISTMLVPALGLILFMVALFIAVKMLRGKR